MCAEKTLFTLKRQGCDQMETNLHRYIIVKPLHNCGLLGKKVDHGFFSHANVEIMSNHEKYAAFLRIHAIASLYIRGRASQSTVHAILERILMLQCQLGWAGGLSQEGETTKIRALPTCLQGKACIHLRGILNVTKYLRNKYLICACANLKYVCASCVK